MSIKKGNSGTRWAYKDGFNGMREGFPLNLHIQIYIFHYVVLKINNFDKTNNFDTHNLDIILMIN